MVSLLEDENMKQTKHIQHRYLDPFSAFINNEIDSALWLQFHSIAWADGQLNNHMYGYVCK